MPGTRDEHQRLWPSLLARLRAAGTDPGRALAQALARVMVVILAGAYLMFAFRADPASETLIRSTVAVILLGALTLLGIQALLPRPSAQRRVVTIAFDVASITWAMYLAGPAGAPLYPLYLWVAFSSGFGYGAAYSYLSTALSLIGFSVVIIGSSFWLQHVSLSIGLMMGLTLLPIYVATLLRRLANAVDRSERARHAKDGLLTELTRELRTPLHGIMGMSDLLRETALSREQREFTDTISYSANNLVSVLENVLDYSKLETGKLTLRSADFDLHSLLNGTIRMLRAQARKKEIRLELQIDPEIPFHLRGDPHQLRHVLTNLITNAIRLTPHGRIDVRVALLGSDAERVRLRFEIEDTGIGIAPEAYARDFEDLAQAEQDLAYGYGDGHLSAVIARQLVALMGGRMEHSNRPGRGTVLRVELQFAHRPALTEPSGSLEHARVLLVSDELSPNLTPIGEWLHGWRARLDVVETASAAFVRAETEIRHGMPYHAVIVDKPLVDTDARHFAQALRKVAPAASVGLILVARQTEPARHHELLGAGYSCVLSSPVDKRLLFNALHAAPVLDLPANAGVVQLHARRARARSTAKARILVAEDNPTNQKFIARVLERAGHEVDTVQNGEEALDALDSRDYDLVILDMHMPVMDGVQTAKLYRFIHPGKSNVPFVMLTANATPEAKLECEAVGVDTFLTRPIEAPRLLEIIERALGRSRRESAGAAAERDARHRERPGGAGDLPEAPPVLNLSSLQEVQNLGYGNEFFHELIQGFIRDGNSLLSQMEDAVAREDYTDLRDAGYALKGNAGSIGAVKLYKSCLQVERMSRADCELLGRQLVADIRAEFQRASAALIEYSKKLGNNARN